MKFISNLALLGLSAYFVASAPVDESCNEPPPPSPPPSSSSVPVGAWIYSCTVPGTVALTFDDGPVTRTGSVLDQLRDAGMSATFFVNGLNWGDINSESSKALVRRMVAEGHQVGSHTYVSSFPSTQELVYDICEVLRKCLRTSSWSHPNLASLGRDDIVNQMAWLEDSLNNIIGFHPTYMRPPYFGANDFTLQVLGDLGYHVLNADIDTFDWQHQSPSEIGNSVQIFKDRLNAGGSIVLAHDVHQYTVEDLVPAMINEIRARGLTGMFFFFLFFFSSLFLLMSLNLRSAINTDYFSSCVAVTVGQCLGDPSDNWYRT